MKHSPAAFHAMMKLASQALPLMNEAQRTEADAIIAELQTANAEPTLADFKAQAAAAFEDDMQPFCKGLAAALHANDLAALKGLRALLPHYLAAMNEAPALADLLALQLGTEIIAGMKDDAPAPNLS
jgi:hypothetical protein